MKKSPHVPRGPRPSRRNVLKGASGALGFGLGTAAWPSPSWSDQSSREKPQGQTLRVLIPDGSQSNLAPIVHAFEKATGHLIALDVCSTESVATEMLLRSLAEEVDFDVALPPTFSLPDLVEAGVIIDLHRFLPNERSKSLYALGETYAGHTYGLQTDGDVYLMFYSKEMLEDESLRRAFQDRTGRQLTVPATWEELDETMEFMHAPDEGRYGGSLFRTPGYIAWEFWVRLHGKGVFPVTDQMRPMLDSPEGLAAAEELIAASQWLHPSVGSAGLFDNWEIYGQGQTFCNIGWGGSQKYFNGPDSAIRDKIVFAPLPGGAPRDSSGERPSPIPYFNWGWNFTVSSACKVPKIAAEFALAATDAQVSLEAIRAADGFFDPYLPLHYGDAEIQSVYSKPFLEEHRRSLTAAIPDFYIAGRGDYFDLLGRSLTRAYMGKTSVGEAMGVAARGWDRITKRHGRERQIAQWQTLKSEYPAHLREQLRSS